MTKKVKKLSPLALLKVDVARLNERIKFIENMNRDYQLEAIQKRIDTLEIGMWRRVAALEAGYANPTGNPRKRRR